MHPETPFQYCCVNCVSIILVPPRWPREIIYVGVGPRQKHVILKRPSFVCYSKILVFKDVLCLHSSDFCFVTIPFKKKMGGY